VATTLLLARHGETDWNRDRRIQGHSDVPLNDAGRAQAAELGRRLDVLRLGAVYSSDLSRARETAVIAVGGRLPVIELDALREKHFGTWEGLTDADVLRRFPNARAGQWGDGETGEKMSSRVVAALLGIAAAHHDETVLVVTHGGPIRAALRREGIDPGPIGNCQLTRVAVVGDRLARLD